MIFWFLIIGAIIWTIDLTWRMYRVSGSVGSAFVVFIVCLVATPIVPYLIVGKDHLYN